MDIEALRQTLEQATLASLMAGFTIGFRFSFNPVALAAIPVSLALVTKAHAPQRVVLYSSMFVAEVPLPKTRVRLRPAGALQAIRPGELAPQFL